MRVLREFFTIGGNEYGPLAHSGEPDQPVGTLFASCFCTMRMSSIALIPSPGAFMSTFRRCQECGRRLTDVLFCPRCGEWFCCTACLADGQSPAPTFKPTTGQLHRNRPVRILRLQLREYSGLKLNFKGLRSDFWSPRCWPAVTKVFASQKRFQAVQTHRLGEVGVEAGFLGAVSILFLSVSRQRHQKRVFSGRDPGEGGGPVPNRTYPAC